MSLSKPSRRTLPKTTHKASFVCFHFSSFIFDVANEVPFLDGAVRTLEVGNEFMDEALRNNYHCIKNNDFFFLLPFVPSFLHHFIEIILSSEKGVGSFPCVPV